MNLINPSWVHSSNYSRRIGKERNDLCRGHSGIGCYSKNMTYSVTTQKESDDLGTLSIFFYDPIIVSAEGGKYELFNISNGMATATFTPVKTSRY